MSQSHKRCRMKVVYDIAVRFFVSRRTGLMAHAASRSTTVPCARTCRRTCDVCALRLVRDAWHLPAGRACRDLNGRRLVTLAASRCAGVRAGFSTALCRDLCATAAQRRLSNVSSSCRCKIMHCLLDCARMFQHWLRRPIFIQVITVVRREADFA
jgi:hypothetical protein